MPESAAISSISTSKVPVSLQRRNGGGSARHSSVNWNAFVRYRPRLVEALRHKMQTYVPGSFEGRHDHGEQVGLFDQPLKPVIDSAQARRSDPPTSRLAAARVMASGRVSVRNRKILNFLLAHDGDYTYREIGRAIDEDPTETMRRLDTLRKKGLIEKYGCRNCSVNGNLMTTWRAKR